MARVKGKCGSPQCDRDAFCKGLCYSHYRRVMRGGTADAPINETYARGSNEQVTTRVTPECLALLEAVASVQNITRYELLRRIVADWYDRAAPEGAPPKSNGNG